MPKLIALWSVPDGPASFDADYESTHAVLASKLPGVAFESASVVHGDKHRVAILSWETQSEFDAAMASPEMGLLMQDAGRLQQEHGAALETLITR